MAFGPIMQMKVGELDIELAPLNRDVMGEFVSPGMQHFSVTRYLGRRTAPVLEDEHEWFDDVRARKDSLLWGIWDATGERTLIGTVSLNQIGNDYLLQSSNGLQIFRPDYWGKGIASCVHKALAWYAFEQLGLYRVRSAAYQPNIGSRKSLENAGFRVIQIERNVEFIDGALRHMDNFECLNPAPAFWRRWWGSDRPSKSAIEARTRTIATLEWATQNVTLP